MRKRFRKNETFQPHDLVEWLNATSWKQGRVVSSLERDEDGVPYYNVKNLVGSRTTMAGEVVRGYPGHVRKV